MYLQTERRRRSKRRPPTYSARQLVIPECGFHGSDAPEITQQEAERGSYYPSVVGLFLLAHMFHPSSFRSRMYQLCDVRGHNPQQTWRRREPLCPVLMPAKATKQPSALGQSGEHARVVGPQSSMKDVGSNALYRVEKTYGRHFPWIQCY